MKEHPLVPPQLATQRLIIRLANKRDVHEIARYYRTNRAFLAPFEPTRSHDFFAEEFWRGQVERNLIEFNYNQSLRLFVFEQEKPEVIIGIINFTQFFRSPLHGCTLGYSLAESKQGKGYMTEAVGLSIQYVFNELNMHRVSANYMPRNQRSGNLLKRLGFVVEGYARDYLLINGNWEDHILTSLINRRWQAD
ncbi:MAG: ribosomal protein S5-alanine N-acetyltransferase [Stenomitos rutilans HA7619-LM2]|jgi:ribosomal-protein-alanine N-acetyltransferase|nr:ribosomal protein S5-alanine N-acetyltransferase [Stenomitos rutilans HA7619-LM2]